MQKGSRPHLLSFGVVDLGEITTELDGDLNILDFILNKFNNFVINLVKDFVVTALEIPLKVRTYRLIGPMESRFVTQIVWSITRSIVRPKSDRDLTYANLTS